MKECGEMESVAGREGLLMQMETFIRESGLMIWQMGMEYLWTLQAQSIQEHG